MRQKMLLLLAVIFGLLAFALTYQQLEYEKRRISGDSETVILIKTTRNMVEGEEINASDVARCQVQRNRANAVPSREIPWSELPRVIGRKLETSLPAGQILQTTDLKPPTRRNGFTRVVQQDWRAVSIPVDMVSSVSNLVQPNDNVDVIGTFRFPDAKGDNTLDTVTLTILQDVKVLAVGSRWGTSLGETGAAPRTYSTVTLQVLPAEVEMLVFASQKGRLTLSLRNFDDARIDRSIEKRSVNFRRLEEEIPLYNQMRQRRRSLK